MRPPKAAVPAAYSDFANPGGFHHITALDGIRGLAILMVLGDHLLWANAVTGSSLMNVLSNLRGALWIGVNVFFALSGFLITGILCDTVTRPNFFRNFYARRTLRIFPLYYGVLLVLICLTNVLPIEWNHKQYYYLLYIDNIALWQHMGMYIPNVNINHFWTLQVEEQFYLVWPLVVWKIRNRLRLAQVALITCLVVLGIRTGLVLFRAHFSNEFLPLSPTFSCVDNLLYGCVLAILLRTDYRQKVLSAAPKVFYVCLAGILALGIEGRGLLFFGRPLQQTIGMSMLGIGSSAMIAMALMPTSTTARFFDMRFLRFFGKYSYGLYVFHYTIDGIVSPIARAAIFTHLHSKALGVVGGALISCGISVVAALVSYHLYEKQFLRLKRYFSYKAVPAQEEIVST